MDDFERITVGEARNAVSFTGDNLPIAFDDDARRPNFQLLEERGDSKSVSDFPFLAVNFQFHSNKKTASAAASQSCQGIRFQVCPALDKTGRRLSRFPTPVRPGSGSKGYLS